MLYSKMDADFYVVDRFLASGCFTYNSRSCCVVDHESIFSDLFETLSTIIKVVSIL